MTNSRTLLPRIAALLATAGLVGAGYAARLERVAHDLTPRFAQDQKLTVRTGFNLSLTLDDAEMKFGEMTLPQSPTVNVTVEGEENLTEVIEAAKDGNPTTIKRTYGTDSVNISGQAGMGEMMQDLDESEESDLSGRVLRITKTEDGVEVEDLTNEGRSDNERVEDLKDSQRALVTLDSHFEFMLPGQPVEVGESWDIGKSFIEKATQMLGAAAAQEEDAENAAKMREVMDLVLENLEHHATGKLVAIDGDMAQLAFDIDAKIAFDDFASLIERFADDEDEMPEDMDGEIAVTLKMKGTGVFNMAAHQLSELDLQGEFEMELRMSMTQMDTPMSMNGSMSGTIGLSGGVQVNE